MRALTGSRCNRLNKECAPGQPVLRKKPRRPRIKNSRTAQLEEKLDGLVSLLTGQNSDSGLSPHTDARYIVPPYKPIAEPLASQSIDTDARNWVNPGISDDDPSASHTQYPSSMSSHGPIPTSLLASCVDDQLQVFRHNMASQFPFVIIPEDMTAEVLRAEKPFLYKNIMMVTSYSRVSRQLRLRSDVINAFTEQIFIQGKKSLDLLQGILIFAAWYHHYQWSSPQMTNMIQVATALVFDLGLHRTQSTFDGHDMFIEAIKSLNDKETKQKRTLEERRAFLGLFCLSRGLSANIGKIEPIQNTPYVEECCTCIEKQQEYLSDRYLVFQARLQIVADAGVRTFPFHGVDYWTTVGTEPIFMLVKSFEGDLERFKNTLDPQLVQSTLFQIHLSSISMHNTKIALRRSPPAGDAQFTTNPSRLALLMTCLQSTKTFFAEWLSLPPTIYHHLPMNVFVLVGHAAIVLGMLNFCQYDGWDLNYVRQIAPFSPTLDALARKYEEASRETDNGGTNGCSAFWRGGMKMKRLVEWYDTRLKGSTQQEKRGNENLEIMVEQAMKDVTTEFDIDMFEFWNEPMSWTTYDDVL